MPTPVETPRPEVRRASADELDAVRLLFREYAGWLGVDLCFQGFEQELESLPGAYTPPRGGIWVADAGGDLVGVVALRPHEGDVAELKRLWVRASHRGQRLGRRLTLRAIEAARQAGYATIRLDTLEHMAPARALYRELGFRTTEAYYHNPLAGVVYMALDLRERP